MKLNIRSAIVSGFVSLAFATTVFAEPYQFEGIVTGGQIKYEGEGGGTASEDQFSGGLRYYLRPVDTSTGPLAERAFLNKAAFIGGGLVRVKGETGLTYDTISPQARFVTQSNMIVEARYSQFKSDNSEDRSSYSVGLGKYLDDRSEAVVTYSAPNDDLNIITGRYRTLLNGSTEGTYIRYSGSLGYLDGTNDTGYQFVLDGTYYFSDQLSAAVGVDYTKFGEFDGTAFDVRGTYFISEKLFGNVFLVSADNSFGTKRTDVILGVGARF